MINFLNCRINISKKVFEPRQETEYWVGQAIKEINVLEKEKFRMKVLDIFAGSGCIGIFILKNTKNIFLDFSDIDEKALKEIKKNLFLNNISKDRFNVFKSDIFENLKRKKYDFILANPPYVALERIKEVQKEVLKKDPHIALFAGDDGMFYIKKFLNEVKKYLKPKGKIYMEFDPLQKNEIKKILIRKKFKYKIKKDQFKKNRYLVAEK